MERPKPLHITRNDRLRKELSTLFDVRLESCLIADPVNPAEMVVFIAVRTLVEVCLPRAIAAKSFQTIIDPFREAQPSLLFVLLPVNFGPTVPEPQPLVAAAKREGQRRRPPIKPLQKVDSGPEGFTNLPCLLRAAKDRGVVG